MWPSVAGGIGPARLLFRWSKHLIWPPPVPLTMKTIKNSMVASQLCILKNGGTPVGSSRFHELIMTHSRDQLALSDTPLWFCLRTQPKHEHFAATALRRPAKERAGGTEHPYAPIGHPRPPVLILC